MKSLPLFAASAGAVFLSLAAGPARGGTKTLVVAPGISGAWDLPRGTLHEGQFLFDPKVPMGAGALVMTMPEWERLSVFTTGACAGVRLKDLKSLKYTVQRTAGTASPLIELEVDFDLKDASPAPQGKLIYDPALNGTVTTGKWQTWNASGGRWYFEASAAAANANAEGGQPFPKSAPATLKEILTQFPNAGISTGTGALSLKGGGETGAFTAAVDSLTVTYKGGGATWNFEPDTDGDLVPDLNDRARLSDLRAKVEMGFGPTSVDNTVDKNGVSIQDKVLKALVSSKNPDKYLKAIAGLTKDLQKAGAITAAQNAELKTAAGYFVYSVMTGGSGSGISGGIVISAGGGMLQKNGSSGLTLTGVNTYSGGTTINNGLLDLNVGGLNTGNGAVELGSSYEFLNTNGGAGPAGVAAGNLRINLLNNLVPLQGGGNDPAFGGRLMIAGGGALNVNAGAANAGLVIDGFNTAGGDIVKADAGSQVLEGGEFAGHLQIIQPGNVVQLQGVANDAAFGGRVVMAGGGVLNLAGNTPAGGWVPAIVNTGSITVSDGARVVIDTTNLAISSYNLTGTLTIGQGATVTIKGSAPVNFSGTVVNNGTLRVERGATLDASGSPGITNNGTIDAIAGTLQLPSTLTQGPAGRVLDAGAVQVLTAAHEGNNFTLTVEGFAGHTYQLQRATNLEEGFTSTGAPQTGAGAVLTFTSDEATGPRGFYRVAVDP